MAAGSLGLPWSEAAISPKIRVSPSARIAPVSMTLPPSTVRFNSCDRSPWPLRWLVGVIVLLSGLPSAALFAEPTDNKTVAKFLDRYCSGCHEGPESPGQFDLLSTAKQSLSRSWRSWERVLRKLDRRQMPPPGEERPTEAEYTAVVQLLSQSLDAHWAKRNRVAPPAVLRRFTRREYQNAIRDLLDLHIDAAAWLPADESSGGFDNITVGELSPLLLDRYVTAAQKISRLAIGNVRGVQARTVRLPPDLTQEQRVAGLPLGTRGGINLTHHFPRSGEYQFTVRLARDRNEEVEGLRRPHTLELLLDRRPLKSFVIKPPKDKNHSKVDRHLQLRVHIPAGTHQLGVTFRAQPRLLEETKRQPYDAHFNMHRHPRLSPAVYQVSITGPFEDGESHAKEVSPTHRRLKVLSGGGSDEDQQAKAILASLMRRAYRRPITAEDERRAWRFFEQGRGESGFDGGLQSALASILVSPHFLFRVEGGGNADVEDIQPTDNDKPQEAQFALASRLAFFLWASLPDERLLSLAESGELHHDSVLRAEVRRMLNDPRSDALATNFADQWLQLRNLDSATPDQRLYPDFDENLRRAFRRETQLLVLDVLRRNEPVERLIRSDYTFLNERLARHYQIPHVLGSRFRRVRVDAESHRGGILRHGGVLTVTSYANRTSPVLRGKWILDNVLGSPPPPPPDDVPALEDNRVDATLSVRERLAAHRANIACASCHDRIDPLGFALENYDAIGRYREFEVGQAIDASGRFFTGRSFRGVEELEQILIERPDWFAGTLAERLMTYALGRSLDEGDAATIRTVLREAADDEYRFGALIEAIVVSEVFRGAAYQPITSPVP